MKNTVCYIASAFSTRIRALIVLNQGHVDEFKSNVLRLVNISKIVDQLVNIAVARHVWERENLICGLFCLCYITKHLMTAPSGNICFCLPQISMFPSTNIAILEKQNRCSPRKQSLSVYYSNGQEKQANDHFEGFRHLGNNANHFYSWRKRRLLFTTKELSVSSNVILNRFYLH